MFVCIPLHFYHETLMLFIEIVSIDISCTYVRIFVHKVTIDIVCMREQINTYELVIKEGKRKRYYLFH